MKKFPLRIAPIRAKTETHFRVTANATFIGKAVESFSIRERRVGRNARLAGKGEMMEKDTLMIDPFNAMFNVVEFDLLKMNGTPLRKYELYVIM